MKKLSERFMSLPAWKALILFFVVITIMCAAMFLSLVLADGSMDTNPLMKDYLLLKVCLTIAAIMSPLLTAMHGHMKRSDKFWEYSKEVEYLIEDATTKDELRSIYKNEYVKLNNMAFGSPHYNEIMRLQAIMVTKIKYLPTRDDENKTGSA